MEALRRIKAWLPSDAIVTVPVVYKYDQEANVIVMEDCGERSVTLKEFMQQNTVSLELSASIGTALGRFAGGMHVWSRGDASICQFFEGNNQAKAMSAWVIYGRLVPTLRGEEELQSLIDPPLAISETEMEVAKKVATDTTATMIAANETVS